MREQLQCRRIIVPAIRPNDSVKHLSILFQTSRSVKTPPVGGACTTRGMAGVLNRQFSARRLAKSCCIRATVSTSISTGDPTSFYRSGPLSRGPDAPPPPPPLGGKPGVYAAGRPPLGGVVTSSYIKICLLGDNRGAWIPL